MNDYETILTKEILDSVNRRIGSICNNISSWNALVMRDDGTAVIKIPNLYVPALGNILYPRIESESVQSEKASKIFRAVFNDARVWEHFMGMDLKFGVDEVTQNRTSRIGVWPKGHIFQSCSENEMKKFQDLFRRRNWKFMFIQNQVDICGIHARSYTNAGDVDCFILDEVETKVVDKHDENEIFTKLSSLIYQQDLSTSDKAFF